MTKEQLQTYAVHAFFGAILLLLSGMILSSVFSMLPLEKALGVTLLYMGLLVFLAGVSFLITRAFSKNDEASRDSSGPSRRDKVE